MQPSPAKFSARAIRASWWLGMASLAFGLFIKITSELLEHEVSGVDCTILIGFAKARTPWLTGDETRAAQGEFLTAVGVNVTVQ